MAVQGRGAARRAARAQREQEGEVESLPDTGDLEADLKLVLRATVDELNDPRYDAPMRALATEILHDPALHAAVDASGSTRR